MNFIYIYLF